MLTLREKSFTNGTIGLITTTSFAPAWIARSRFVVETMPPSISSRSCTRTGAYTIGKAPDARTAVEIGTSIEPSTPSTTRSQLSRSVAVRYSSQSSLPKSSVRPGSFSTSRR